ncbi:MAG: helix-turn-helix domain-containing protein [Pyrinomonadaceae bacterium]|nr:helix-turn-helix domain-containing protein [Pyrinomonadaceae bacterium]
MGSAKRLDKHAPKRLGEKLLKIREAFGDTQADFLERLGNPDAILQTSISAYEKGKREPPLLILLKYAKLAKISTDILIDDSLELPNKTLCKNI